jgi:hypothetical protein
MSDDIKVLSDSVELIRARPEMYWGKKNPDSHDPVHAMVDQLLIQNCENININKKDDWYFIGSASDWISPGLDNGMSVQELFTKGRGFPEAKVAGSIRSELLIYDFATDVVLWFKNELQTIKGNVEEREKILEFCKKLFNSSVAVGFKGNTYV